MKTRFFQFLTAALFLAVIFAVPVLTKLEDNAELSQFEYRELSKPPVIASAATLFDPAYYAQWETYFSDHIWQRENLLTFYTHLNMNILKRPVVNGEIIQEDLLLPFIRYGQSENLENDMLFHAGRMSDKLQMVNDTVKSYGGSFIYILVPEQYSFFRDRFPSYLNNRAEQLGYMEDFLLADLLEKGVDCISMRQEFNGNDSFYSRTDHHFSFKGAYFTYQTLLGKLNTEGSVELPVLEEDEIEFVTVENPFYGSRNRKLYNLYPSDEKLTYYIENTPLPFRRTDNEWRYDYPLFNIPEDAEEPVTFGMYMGGDVKETVIQTDRPELPNALIFGDSFTNPVETFLSGRFLAS